MNDFKWVLRIPLAMDISHLALALGSSLTAGLNLYITVLTLGLLQRYEVLQLPANLQILSNPWILTAAGVLFAIEFVADKVPYVDNAWDVVHGFIRVPAGAVLAAASVGELPTHLVWIAALVGGFVTLSAHGAKATTRLAVNSTPEPFTNWFLSFFEDGLSLGVLWLVISHPYLALAVASALVVLFTALIILLFRFFRLLWRRVSARPVRV